MNIWIVNHYALKPTEAGGTRHFSLAQDLVKNGHEVTILASSFDHFSHSSRNPGSEVIEGVRFVWLKTSSYAGNGLGRMWNIVEFGRALKYFSKPIGLANRPDVILGSSPHPVATYVAARIAKAFGVPFVLEIRDLWPDSLIELGKVSPLHPLIIWFKYLLSRSYAMASKIIVLPPLGAQALQSRGIDCSKIVHIPNGIRAPQEKPSYSMAGDKFKIIYAGALGLSYELDLVLDCAKLLDSDRFSIELMGHGSERDRLKKRIIEEKIASAALLPAVAKSEVHKKLKDAHLLLMPIADRPVYRFGISTNKMFEYMAAARPVIAYPPLPEHPLEKSKGGWILERPLTASRLAAAILNASALPLAELEKLGESNWKFVKENYDQSYLSQCLENLLNGVINEARA